VWTRAPLLLVTIAIAAAACHSGDSAPAPPASSAEPSPAAAPASSAADREGAPADPARFRAAIKSAPAGQWSAFEQAVLAPRDRGTWDDYRVGSPVVMKDAAESRYRMWFVGCRLAADRHDCAVGHATSADGIAWTRADSPVFVPPNMPASYWLNAITVVKAGDRYLLWYSIDGDSFGDRPRATLHLATSTDGTAWQETGLVHTTMQDRSRAIRHATHYDGKLFHLWYFDFPDSDHVEALVHLTSPDGRVWTMAGSDTLDDGAARVGRPFMTSASDGRGGFRALLVDRRNRGERPSLRWLMSVDGTMWTDGPKERESLLAPDLAIVDLSAVDDAGGLWIWTTMAAPEKRSAESIGVAFKKGSGS
jgi:hypothetical protein